MQKVFFILLLLPQLAFAQFTAHRPVHLKEVLENEKQLESCYISLVYPDGLEEAVPLHFYKHHEDIERLATYYYRKSDSIISKAVIQYAKFTENFNPDLSWSAEEFRLLTDLNTKLKKELATTYGNHFRTYNETSRDGVNKETYFSTNPLLYNPRIEFKHIDLEERKLGVLTQIYENQAYLSDVHMQLEYLSHYFLDNLLRDKTHIYQELLGKELKAELGKHPQVLEELKNILATQHKRIVNINNGVSDLHQEYALLYHLYNEAQEHEYNLVIAFNNQQEVIYLQYTKAQ